MLVINKEPWHMINKGGVSMRFTWQDISMLSAAWETFCGINNPQLNISNLDIVNILENIFYACTI
jgi:hypothetical protein